jgi:hypothetical protein
MFRIELAENKNTKRPLSFASGSFALLSPDFQFVTTSKKEEEEEEEEKSTEDKSI